MFSREAAQLTHSLWKSNKSKNTALKMKSLSEASCNGSCVGFTREHIASAISQPGKWLCSKLPKCTVVLTFYLVQTLEGHYLINGWHVSLNSKQVSVTSLLQEKEKNIWFLLNSSQEERLTTSTATITHKKKAICIAAAWRVVELLRHTIHCYSWRTFLTKHWIFSMCESSGDLEGL